LNEYGSRNKIITYVQDEGFIITSVLIFIVKYYTLSSEDNFHETCFEHVFSKACQYLCNVEKVYSGLKYVFIESTQPNL